MSAKPHISDGPGMRVGVPLARAQRLAARTETRQQRQRAPALLIGAAVVVLAAAGLLSPGSQPDRIAAVTETAFAGSDFSDLPPLATPHPDLRARLIACVGEIEDRLRTLGSATEDPARSAALSDLMQGTLDCRAASLEIEGSLELVSTGIADLQVRWERDTSRLLLTVVDAHEAEMAQTIHTEDGLPVSFVVH